MEPEITAAALALFGSLCGTYWANRRASALIAYRLEQLEKKVHKHNSVIERTYEAERQLDVLTEKQRVANHRIDDLENKINS